MVLMTPCFLEPNRADAMRAAMDRYGDAVKAIAKKHGASLADTQAAFDPVLAEYHPMAIAWDRIHVNHIGHMVLARAFLQTVAFDW